MRFFRLGVAAMTAGLMVSPAFTAERSVTGGIIRGVDTPEGEYYLGIPYAAPPVGPLRWAPPAPVVSWSGVRDATQQGAPCKQPDLGWNSADAAISREDCLTLDVAVPKGAASHGRLPVMIWYHGGANTAGSGIGYTHSPIIRHGVVLVTVQYRLGVFGFLSHPALSAASAQHASGNYGLMDQIAVLKWVQANIAALGGDPGNVTIFGQSAGAQDVGQLLLSPLARGLFHKAIAQSGTAGFGLPPRTLKENEKLGEDLAALLGFPAGERGLNALRAAPAEAVMAAAQKLVPPIADAGFIWDQAVVDGVVLPKTPAAILAAGEQAPVPLLIGDDARELPLYGGDAAVRSAVALHFEANVDSALKFYGLDKPGMPADDPVLGSVATQIATDVMFRLPINTVAAHQRAIGQKVWRYQFDLARFGTSGPVWHSSELGYVFDAPAPGADFSRWPPVQAYWTNFAKNSDPNGAGLPHWSDMGLEKNYMEFSATGLKLGRDLRGGLSALWNKP